MNATINPSIPSLARDARELTRIGRTAEAALLWQRVLAAEPNHTEALLGLAVQALAREEPAAALQMLEHAAITAPRDPMVQVYTAVALKGLARPDAEMAAIQRALAIDPYFYPALLHQGMLLERLGKRRHAARVFNNVLKIMPAPDRARPGYRRAAEHAEAAIQENSRSLERHLDTVLAELRRKHSAAQLKRFEETVHLLTGTNKRYVPDPVLLYFAQLPELQFYDESLFPWLAELEAASVEIRRECEAVLFGPPGDVEHGDVVARQMATSQPADPEFPPARSSFNLWDQGKRIDANCERCPGTAQVVESLPLARVPNFSPSVRFSAVEARAVMPPRTGDTNARLIVSLPLIAPPGWTVRVGNETRAWTEGKARVFDDSFEHETGNMSDQTGAQLVFDIWNPNLSEAERELVVGLLNGVSEYYDAEA